MAAGGDLEAAARAGVEAAIDAGAGDAEAYAVEEATREVRVHERELESLTAATERGVGVRAWIGGRVGFAYGTDLSAHGLRATATLAAEAASIADEDEHAGPPGAAGPPPTLDGLRDGSVSAWGPDRAADLALAVERAALGGDDRITGVEQAVYADSAERVAIASSTGMDGSYETSSCYAWLQAMAASGDGRETGLGFGMARGPAGLDPEAIGAEAAQRAVSMIGAVKPESRSCPAVLDTTVAASFAGLIGSTLAADSVQRGRSPFAGKLGEEVASDALELHDDALDPDGLASSPFDGEGVPCGRRALIEGRRLRTYLHDSYTARRDGVESTGNAGRAGYRSQPSVSASNLVVGTGGRDLAGLFEQAAEGVYVTDVAGLHSGVNPVTGTFSVGASGTLIRGGEQAEPVREFTIAGDLVSLLGAVVATGSRRRWVPFGGSVSTPPVLVGEITVGGS
ncbi:MAG TPA: TldD/PmbA family protein [Solirubrobacterales bacterium]|nr:TldD/PmbA family protein [Solirubrobacterales bacterium]